MTKVFLSYAREDGSAAAAKLRSELERAKFEVWRDIEEMAGGIGWQEQIRAALHNVDVVVVLLTPKAVESPHVTSEWTDALSLGKRVIPVLILPCAAVPAELARLHYHRLDQPDGYAFGLAALLGDLGVASSDGYRVLTPANSAIVSGALVINGIGQVPLRWNPPKDRRPDLIETAVGREAELATLHAQLQTATSTAITGKITSAALQGLPGVGKSTLAAKYVASHADHYPGGVLWLTFGPEARDETSVNPLLNRIAAYACDVQSLQGRVQFSPELVQMLLAEHGPLLLVADDVWSEAVVEPLRRMLPADGRLLITTREMRVAARAGKKLELEVLSEEEALALVRQRLPELLRNPGEEAARRLARAVGYHPLALEVALGDLFMMAESGWADGIERLERSVEEGESLGDLPLIDELDRKSRVEKVLRHSYLSLTSALQARFKVLGCMAPEASFDTAAAAVVWREGDEAAARGYLDALRARALLKSQGTRWQQHSILRAYALSLESDEERSTHRRAHAAHEIAVAEACLAKKPRDYERLEREFPQVVHAFAWIHEHAPEWTSDLIERCADFMFVRGRIALLHEWLRRSQANAHHQSGVGNANTLKSLGDLESQLGNVEKARGHYDAALPLYEAEQDRLGKANTLKSLGDLESRLGNVEKARGNYDAALPL
ncbi:MAG TPA: TIR domain-containing protein, partial [Myxococcaceae bacterium]|nr:TIR domain-containing protein [Myxococcaceae bacterium]